MIRTFLILITFLSFLCVGSFVRTEDAKQGDVIASMAQAWLDSVDRGEYRAVWKETAPAFKRATPEKEWFSSIYKYRDALGDLKERRLVSIQYHPPTTKKEPLTCTLYFAAQFERREALQETILAIYENQQWKIAGYYAQ